MSNSLSHRDPPSEGEGVYIASPKAVESASGERSPSTSSGRGPSASSGRGLGLPDEAFSQKRPDRGLITKAEVRAVALYSMGLRRDSTVWDIGAGTGSVALEAALVAHEGTVYAVERDQDSLGLLWDNLRRLGPDNIQVVPGEAPEALEGLPDPDAVFVGGSGGRIIEILDCCAQRFSARGRIVVNLASFERANSAYHHLKTLGLDTRLTTINVSRGKQLPDGSTRLEALNPVFIIVAQAKN